MNLLVVYNPSARAGRAARLEASVLDAFKSHSVDVEVLQTEKSGQAVELVASSQLDDFDGVVAAGGDGTVFEVLNGLFMHAQASRVPMGILPLGTGNAFAREFDLGPSDWEEAVARIAKGKKRPCDVGRVESVENIFYFLNIIGMGFAFDAGLTAKRLKFVGNAAYSLATLWQVMKLHSYPLVIHLDGERLDQENIFVEISNSRYTGTSFLIAPGAKIDDGLLDVTLLRELGKTRLLRLFPTVYSGRHVQFEEIETRQARHIRIEAPEGMPMTVDGEFHGHTPLEIECLPGALELLL